MRSGYAGRRLAEDPDNPGRAKLRGLLSGRARRLPRRGAQQDDQTVLGLYDDDLVQVDGEWLFASRTLNLLGYSDVPSTYITVKREPVS